MSDIRSQYSTQYTRDTAHRSPDSAQSIEPDSLTKIPFCPLGHRDIDLQSLLDEGSVVSIRRQGFNCSYNSGDRCGFCQYIRLMRENVLRFKQFGSPWFILLVLFTMCILQLNQALFWSWYLNLNYCTRIRILII